MCQADRLNSLQKNLLSTFEALGIGSSFEARAEPIQAGDDHIHFTFTFAEEELVDRLIRTARSSFASFGPEYWLPDSHPGSAQFQQDNHLQYRVLKSLIQSHLYWGVSFILCGPNEGYSLVETTQP
ncbi:hypothetical protein [Pseudomonas sp. GOM6]|uniref:hypothetical protein n=1 Tax=Pseudomonas sp. GOM6 TaxID=3036944 RepID=UPI00240921E6|nr:hypothetical protein [Pseudomonas sp. GOM6]MDG1581022.1 hypothetical protein [Pseudomonas sp. GOM6]